MKKKTLVIALFSLALAGCLGLAGCGGTSEPSPDEQAQEQAAQEQAAQEQAAQEQEAAPVSTANADIDEELVAEELVATVKVKGYDPFEIELDGKSAPITVTNFVKLAKDGYYDGLAFYRVVPDFCLQGGTKGDNAAGNDADLEPIVGEFSLNGYENALADHFKKGVVAMARSSNPDSATSTFFITLGSSDNVSYSLDRQYAAFGTIDRAGMKVVDQIVKNCAEADTDAMGGIANKDDMPIIKSITVK